MYLRDRNSGVLENYLGAALEASNCERGGKSFGAIR